MARSSTYSIVACDLERHEWGVAVQSRFLAIGALAAFAEAEVGAVATQSFMNTDYGHTGLRLIREGLSARDALDRVLASDPEPEKRQVGVVDRDGTVASHTGAACMDWAGHQTGEGFAAQGNMLVSADTVDALADTFAATEGPLARRLLAALLAAQAAGGDRRGQQSAALIVARRSGGYGGADVAVDLRVDDAPEPPHELERLLVLHDLYFGATPPERWLPVAGELEAELRAALTGLGYATGDLATDLETWAGIENLEERVEAAARIDPVVLAELRRLAAPPADATQPQKHRRSEMTEHDDDVREIRRVHRQWWEANVGLDVEKMSECFAPDYLMWNLNGHPYYSLAEKEHLFRYYQSHMVPTEPPELWDVRVIVDGDMAYVTSEGILPVVMKSAEGSGSATMDGVAGRYERRGELVRFRFRETVVFRRNDGRGNRDWKIWHFHASPLAPLDEPRPGFGDTAAERQAGKPVEVMDGT